jgi:cytochrome c biogenesis factor
MDLQSTYTSMMSAVETLSVFGGPFEALLLSVAVALAVFAVVPRLKRWRGWALFASTVLLALGEGVLIWFHYRIFQLAQVMDPLTSGVTGRVAVPLWVESEKLFVWALVVAVLGLVMQRHREELLPGVMLITAVLIGGAALLGKPFTQPIPGFFGQYIGYLQAMATGGQAAGSAFTGMESARQFYYNAWFMWVHPPLLFIGYGCFALSFVATLLMISRRHSSYETTAYRWARMGYLPLTLGMLLGFPWALAAWQGEAWWWSGKVNMSLMMWLLYTGVLHARLYLRHRGMWKTVAALSVLSFAVLVLTYATTYLVPGAHSYALEAGRPLLAALTRVAGGAL